MNNKFNCIFLKILFEEKFKDKKWKFIKTFKDVEIYLNEAYIFGLK